MVLQIISLFLENKTWSHRDQGQWYIQLMLRLFREKNKDGEERESEGWIKWGKMLIIWFNMDKEVNEYSSYYLQFYIWNLQIKVKIEN